MKDLIKKAKNSLFEILDDNRTRIGTGFAIQVNEKSQIITCEHVIKNRQKIYVKNNGGEIIEAHILVSNQDADFAILKVDKIDSYLEIEMDIPQEGEEVIFIGFPLDVQIPVTTKCIISGIQKRTKDNSRELLAFYLDAQIPNGFSGGPVISLNSKKVIGIISSHFDANYHILAKTVTNNGFIDVLISLNVKTSQGINSANFLTSLGNAISIKYFLEEEKKIIKESLK